MAMIGIFGFDLLVEKMYNKSDLTKELSDRFWFPND